MDSKVNENKCFSQNTTSSLVDQVVAGHANDVIEMKNKVEEMWTTSDSKRVRRSKASEGIPGFSLFADNVGKLENNFYNWKDFGPKILTTQLIFWVLTQLKLPSYYVHLAGKVVNQRHNTGLDHKGHYLNMAQVLAIENRVPSAHQR